jgi:hypothetical protein
VLKLWLAWQVPKIPLLNPSGGQVQLQEEVLAGMRESIFLAEATVKPLTPVRTGRLRSGWTPAVELVRGTPVQFQGRLTNAVPYAGYVEQRRFMLRTTVGRIQGQVHTILAHAVARARQRLMGG